MLSRNTKSSSRKLSQKVPFSGEILIASGLIIVALIVAIIYASGGSDKQQVFRADLDLLFTNTQAPDSLSFTARINCPADSSLPDPSSDSAGHQVLFSDKRTCEILEQAIDRKYSKTNFDWNDSSSNNKDYFFPKQQSTDKDIMIMPIPEPVEPFIPASGVSLESSLDPFQPCTMIMGGPWQVTVGGTVNDQEVYFVRDQAGGCQIEQFNFWTDLVDMTVLLQEHTFDPFVPVPEPDPMPTEPSPLPVEPDRPPVDPDTPQSDDSVYDIPDSSGSDSPDSNSGSGGQPANPGIEPYPG